jgi:hypothetical protein
VTAKRIARDHSALAKVAREKAPVTGAEYTVTPWEPPTAADRALVRDGLTRNGAHDLVDALGLLAAEPPKKPGWPACPTCGAIPGAVCRRVAGGREMSTVHNERRRV